MSLRAIRVTANLAQQGPERCELGPDLAAALAGEKANAPIAFAIREEDAARLDGCRDLIVDRGRKHPAKPLSPLMLGQRRIPFIRGGHSSPGQVLRSIRALLAHALAQRDGNVFLVGVAGIRRTAGPHQQPPVVAVVEAEAVPPARHEVRRRWAELLRRIFEVDPLRCPRCGDAMRIVGFITEPHVIDRILTHRRRHASPARRARAPPRRRTAARAAPSA